MGARPPAASAARAGAAGAPVWDLATRAFHWCLVLCVACACASAHAGGAAAQRLHFLSGYAVLALVLFRVLWGFCGAYHARFSSFVRGPAALLGYLRGLRAAGPMPAPPAGHSPLGAWSVLALLSACAVQAASGLFTRDEIASEGPLAQFVSERFVARAGAWHELGEFALYALLALHLSAILAYRLLGGIDLVGPMLHGGRDPQAAARPLRDSAGVGAALLLLLWAAGLVAAIAGLAPG